MTVPHFPVNLRLRYECRNRVYNQNIHRTGTNHRFRNIESLLSGVRLRNIEIINIHTDSLCIAGIQSMLRIYESGNSASLLYFRYGMECQCSFSGRLRSVDFYDSPPWKASGPQCNIHGKRSGGHDFYVLIDPRIPELHNGPLSAILFYLR